MDIQALWQRVKKFLEHVWQECKDKKTVALLLVVVLVMYTPAWGGYLVHALFGWEWGSVVASAYLLFWAGPFTPFWPLCIAITLFIKRMIKKRMGKEIQEDTDAGDDAEVAAVEDSAGSESETDDADVAQGDAKGCIEDDSRKGRGESDSQVL